MENKEFDATSKAIEETAEETVSAVMEEMTDAASGSTVKFVTGLGIGVLAGVIICKCVMPAIRSKFRCFRPKYVTVTPQNHNDEQPPREDPPTDNQEDEEDGENEQK